MDKHTPSEIEKRDHAKYYDALTKQQERVEWIIDGINDDKLTMWEAKFVESIQQQSEGGRYLSDRQRKIIERIGKEKSR